MKCEQMPWNVSLDLFHKVGKIGFVRNMRDSFQSSFLRSPESMQSVECAVELVLEPGFGAIHKLDGTARVGGAAGSGVLW